MTINDLLGVGINSLQDYDEYRRKVLYIAEEHFDGNLVMLVHCLAGMVEQLGADNGEPEESKACNKCYIDLSKQWPGWRWGGNNGISRARTSSQ